jgi:hypothetical protein
MVAEPYRLAPASAALAASSVSTAKMKFGS